MKKRASHAFCLAERPLMQTDREDFVDARVVQTSLGNSMKRDTALVTGVGGPSGIAATAALKRHGFTVTAIDMHVVPHSADLFVQVPPVADPGYFSVLREI